MGLLRWGYEYLIVLLVGLAFLMVLPIVMIAKSVDCLIRLIVKNI